MNQTAEDSSRAVFTARMVVMERPEIAEEVSRRAAASGRSLAAEVRAAIRYWLDGWGSEDG
jgi:plasmid stability protein